MAPFPMLIALAVAHAAPSVDGHASAKCSIAVLDLVPRGLTSEDASSLPGLLAEIMANEVAVDSKCQVLSQGDIKGMVDFEAEKAACSEQDQSCLASLGDALGVERIVVGTIGKLGTDYVIAVRLVDNKKAMVVGRGEVSVSGGAEQLRAAAKTAVDELFPVAAAPATPLNVMLIGGVGVGVVGLAGVVGGALMAFDSDGHLADKIDTHKADAFSEGRIGVGLASLGVLAVAGGATLSTFGVIE